MKKVVLNMKENDRYERIKELVDHGGNKKRTAVSLGVTVRQVNRLIICYREKGKNGFQHQNKGRSPVNSLPQELSRNILNLYQTKYKDFNIAHFKDLLEEEENIKISYSSLYRIISKEEILSPKAHKITRKRHALLVKEKEKKEDDEIINTVVEEKYVVAIEDAHPRKPRKKFAGEEIQMDGSFDKWFGNEKSCLHLSVDNSTGTVLAGYFDKQETLNGYYNLLNQILHQYGIPYCFKTDNRTVFNYERSNDKDDNKDVLTQFGYACKQLGISLETTSVSQAKGMIERLNESFQGRLINELKLRNIITMEEANKYLQDVFIPRYNKKFAVKITNGNSCFISSPSEEKINLTLAVISTRKFDNGSSIKYQKDYYQSYDENNQLVCFKQGTECTIIKAFDQSLFSCVGDKIYALQKLESNQKVSENFEEHVEKVEKKNYIPPMNHPWRRGDFLKHQYQAHNHHIYV